MNFNFQKFDSMLQFHEIIKYYYREQLAAIYDEQNGGHYHGGGDGMSSASDSDIKESLGGSSSLSSNDTLLQVRKYFRIISLALCKIGSRMKFLITFETQMTI